MSHRIAKACAVVALATVLGLDGRANAQYPTRTIGIGGYNISIQPNQPFQPVQPGYVPQPNPGFYPQPNPGYVPQPAPGIVTGNPSFPFYNPNGVANATGSGNMYWDPARGWVTNTQTDTVLNSALSPGRAPAAGAQVQYYNYWDGTQWVRGTRWLGQDGLWHGQHSDTTVTPNGSSTNNTVYYAPNPNAGGGTTTNNTAYSVAPAPTTNNVRYAPAPAPAPVYRVR